MNYDVDKYITKLTVMELKSIIKECLREFEDEKQTTETQYKQLIQKNNKKKYVIYNKRRRPLLRFDQKTKKIIKADYYIRY